MLPKLILTDIDGVWTDGGMYYDNTGNELKKFNTYDSAGVLFCKLMDITFGIITGEKNKIIENRAKKLEVEYVFTGVRDKVKVVDDLLNKLGLTYDEVAYIGDDINDLELLKKVGISACPSGAPDYIKSEVDFIVSKKGGEGAFREFVEIILKEKGLLQEALQRYFQQKKLNQ